MTLQLPQRDGSTTIMNLAKTLCRITTAFKPILIQKYGEVPAIAALLDAIDVLCGLLPAADVAWYDPQGDNTDITENPELTPGINPGAPEPPPNPE